MSQEFHFPSPVLLNHAIASYVLCCRPLYMSAVLPMLSVVCLFSDPKPRRRYHRQQGGVSKWQTLRGRHSGGNPLQHPVRSDGVDSGPHEQCGSTTSLDDHCLIAGISCWLQYIGPEVLQRLLETILWTCLPNNHSGVLIKMHFL